MNGYRSNILALLKADYTSANALLLLLLEGVEKSQLRLNSELVIIAQQIRINRVSHAACSMQQSANARRSYIASQPAYPSIAV